MNEYVGAIHIHTNYSDGGGSVRDVLSAARRASADFVVLSDHGCLDALKEGWAGYHDGLLTVVATEITCKGREHILVFGLSDVDDLTYRPAGEVLDVVKSRGGKAFIAHPRVARISWVQFSAGDWQSWHLRGFDGLEIWSLLHDVCDRVQPWNVWRIGGKILKRVKGPRTEVLQQWDRLTQTRQLPAIAGLDTHARRMPIFRQVILGYYETCTTLRTHVFAPPLAGESLADTQQILDAIFAGRCFAALDGLADARGFSFVAVDGGEHILMGEEVRFNRPMKIQVVSPQSAELKLLRNGQVLFSTSGNRLEQVVDTPGVHRVEAYLNGKPWVFTNPIYLRA